MTSGTKTGTGESEGAGIPGLRRAARAARSGPAPPGPLYRQLRTTVIVLVVFAVVLLAAFWWLPNRDVDFNDSNGPVPSEGAPWRLPNMRVLDVAFSPDGEQLAVLGLQQRSTRIWDKLKRFLTANGDPVARRSLAYVRSRTYEVVSGAVSGEIGAFGWMPDSSGFLVCIADDWLADTCDRFAELGLDGTLRHLVAADVDVPVSGLGASMTVASDGLSAVVPTVERDDDGAVRRSAARIDLRTGWAEKIPAEVRNVVLESLAGARWEGARVLVLGRNDDGELVVGTLEGVVLVEEEGDPVGFDVSDDGEVVVVARLLGDGIVALTAAGDEIYRGDVRAFSLHPTGDRVVVEAGGGGLRMADVP